VKPLNRTLFLIALKKFVLFHFTERLFEAQLEAILRSVLENGIPDFGIPQLDPFVYADTVSISEIDLPGMMT
jgi:hypothetical protein